MVTLRKSLGSGKLSLSASGGTSALKESLKMIHLCCTNSPKTRFHNPVILKFLSTQLKVERLLAVVPESERLCEGEKNHSHCQTSRFFNDILVSECLTPGNLPRACFHPFVSWLQLLVLIFFFENVLQWSRYVKIQKRLHVSKPSGRLALGQMLFQEFSVLLAIR